MADHVTALTCASQQDAVKDGNTENMESLVPNESDIAIQTDVIPPSQLTLCSHDYCCCSMKLTALHCAVQRGYLELTLSLVQNSAYLDARSSEGRTALMLAALYSRPDIVTILLEAGACMDLFDDYKFTALHYATQVQNLEAVKILVKHGANLNATNQKLDTPLHIACAFSSVDIIEVLLRGGADYKLKNMSGSSGFSSIIKQTKDAKLIRLCIEKGAWLEGVNYGRVVNSPSLKEDILLDVELCTQSYINNFHYRCVPNINKMLFAANRSRFDMNFIQSEVAKQEISRVITQEIQAKGHSSLRAFPMLLSMLALKSISKYKHVLFKRKFEHADDGPNAKKPCASISQNSVCDLVVTDGVKNPPKNP